MQGSFDHPPIVLRQDRTRLALDAFSRTALAVVFAWLLLHNAPRSALLILFLVAFTAAGLASALPSAWQCWRPGSLTVGPAGLTLRTGRREQHYRWGDIVSFFKQPFLLRGTNRGQVIGTPPQIYCRVSDAATKPGLFGIVWSSDMALGPWWELNGTALIELLEEARRRWGSGRSEAAAPTGTTEAASPAAVGAPSPWGHRPASATSEDHSA